jgi:hypothetical protein
MLFRENVVPVVDLGGIRFTRRDDPAQIAV